MVRAGRIVWAAFALAACACSKSSAPSEVTTDRAALTVSGNRILGFESLADWPLSQGQIPAPVLSTTHTEGSFSLALKAKNFVVVKSAVFPVARDIVGPFTYDLFLPAQQPNPSWFGATQLYVDCPSKSINNAFVGQKELTGLATNRFQPISIALPSALASQLRGGCPDFDISISLNVPSNATGTYLLDNLKFSGSGNRVAATLNCVTTDDGLTYTAYFGYRNLEGQIASIPLGSSNQFSPAPSNRGQPVVFQPGTIATAVAATFLQTQTITWTLNAGSASATKNSAVCPGSTPQTVSCPDAEEHTPGGCARLVILPTPHGPNQDPAVLGQPFDPASNPPPTPGDEDEDDTAPIDFQPTQVFTLLPTQTRVISFPVPGPAIATANARWQGTGLLALTMQVNSVVINGSVTNRGSLGGSVNAYLRAATAGSIQVQVQNTGSTALTNIRLRAGSTPIP